MLEGLVPAGVRIAEAEAPFRTPPSAAPYGIESAAITTACPSRRAEFLAGRSLARQAIGRIGHPPVPLPRDDAGCCVWPRGIVGSISHTRKRCAVAVADAGRVPAIGIDVEEAHLLSDGVVAAITRRDEEQPATPVDPGSCSWHLLRFSAKESVFKAWFAQRRTWLGFHDVAVTFEPQPGKAELGKFRAEIRREISTPGVTYLGHYGVHHSGYVATVAVLGSAPTRGRR